MIVNEIRSERTARLTSSDWTQAQDAPITENERARWREYRQRLRDITDQPGFPDQIIWPKEPEKDPVHPSLEME